MIPVADDARHALAGRLRGGEADQHGARGLGLLQDAHRHLGDDAEQAFRSADDRKQVVAAGIEMLAADPHHLAGDQHHLDAEDVVRGHAVFQAMHAAGILRDVAADGAGDLRRGVRRVIEIAPADRVGNAQIRHARLRHHDAVLVIDVENAVELREPEQNAVGQRQRAARERSARPARHHAHSVGVAVAENFRNLLGGRGQRHYHRQLPIGREPVGLVGPHARFRVDHCFARDNLAQRRHDLGAAREHILVRRRHGDHGNPPKSILADSRLHSFSVIPGRGRSPRTRNP